MWRSLIQETLCQRYFVLIFFISLFATTFIQTTKGSLGVQQQQQQQRKGSIGGNETQVYVKAHDTVKRSPLSTYIPFVKDRSLSTADKAESRGYQNHGGGWGGHYHQQHYYHQHDNNMDLYSLLGGLSFASLLGATLIFLARRNNSGRRRRSLDSIFEDEDDEYEHLVLDAIDTKY